jgi:hypothetical protein
MSFMSHTNFYSSFMVMHRENYNVCEPRSADKNVVNFLNVMDAKMFLNVR